MTDEVNWEKRFNNEFKPAILSKRPELAEKFNKVFKVLKGIDHRIKATMGKGISYHLAVSLFYHLLEALNIPIKGIEYKGEVLNKVSENYPIAYNIAKYTQKLMNDEFKKIVKENEISHIAVLLTEVTGEMKKTYSNMRREQNNA
ncbi:MAG: hypothetical protein PWP21_1271, partial [Thermosediminibacterales bacterium]|nr:hypothetical protein [Thermosediminibacterales bacterium]